MAILSGNTISGNATSFTGGGIYADISSLGTTTFAGNKVSGNSADYGGGGVYVNVSSGTAAIQENLVLYNVASRSGGGGIEVSEGQPTISRNDILANYPRQLWNGNPAASANVDARNNWWGTTNEAEIQEHIWDGNDRSYLGVVDWSPYLTTPVFSNHPPSPAANPFPPSGAIGVPRNPTLSWSPSTDTEPGNAVSYDIYFGASADPSLMASDQSSTSYSPTPLESFTTYYWRVASRDSQGAETYGTRWSFTTGSSSQPILSPIGARAVNEGQTLTFVVSASDADGDSLTYSASNLPSGAGFNAATRTFSWTPTFTQAGAYPNVQFEVSDGNLSDSEEITLTVVNVNQAPTANAQSATTAEDTPAAITLTGSDPEGDSLTFTIVTPPSHGTLGGTAPDLTYTPAADYNGADSFTFQVNDGTADSAPATVSLTVTPANEAPILAPIGNKTVNEGQLLSFTLSASDVDGDALTYSTSNLPSWASFDPPTRTFSWTPTFTQAGAYPNVQFEVSDGNLSDSEEITLTVVNVNQAPTAEAQSATTAEDMPAAITLTGSDPDSNPPLTFTVVTNPTHGTLSGTAPNLTYTPAANFYGSDSFTFKVNDGTADGAPATVSLTVTPANDAPILAPIGNKTVNEGQLLSFTLSASDVDGDALTYSTSNLPSWASFDPPTRTFSWTPTFTQAGAYPNVQFEVSDGSLTDAEEITLRVISSAEAAYAHLAQVMDRYQAGEIPRLLESYTPTASFTSQANVAHLYDSALALLAFLERGTAEDLARARAIAKALVTLQQKDPIGDGRLRDAYAADFLLDGSGKARLQLASTHTGNLAWAILALLRYNQAQGGQEFMEAAVKQGEWIAAHTLDIRGAGGFTGGVDNDLRPISWKSTEHNLDLYAAFMRLYEATGEARWLGWAAHARAFVEAMRDDDEGRFRTGTLEDGVAINREPVPLDVQAWAVLALGEKYARGLDWARQSLRMEPCECGFVGGYRFSTEGNGCWFEGSAHLALARRMAGDGTEADALLGELREIQAMAPNGDGGGIVAACSDGVETGYGWSYYNSLHVGATAWYLLAEQGANPLEVAETAIGASVSGAVRSSDREPVPGARIEARAADGTLVGVTLTDGDGHYQMELPAGRYTLTPSKETHLFSPASRAARVRARAVEAKDFAVKPLALVVVVKDRTGRRLPGVALFLKQGETIVGHGPTDARGRHVFSLYNTGTYTVEPSREGSRFAPESAQVTLTRRKRQGKVRFKEVP